MKEKIRNIINWIEILSAFTAGVIALSPLLFLSLLSDSWEKLTDYMNDLEE